MSKTRTEQVLGLARRKGVLRPKDLEKLGIPRVYLSRLCSRGLLQRVDRGIYMLSDADITEHHSLAEVCKRVPEAKVCLLSALRFHEIGTQLPHEVWIAVGPKARRPKMGYPRLRVMRFSGKALSEGVETSYVEGVRVKVYSPAKTVADCFKYRYKVGLDVALEALRECLRNKRCTVDEIWNYAKICRVANVMRPYLEAI